jgi:alpha-amylase
MRMFVRLRKRVCLIVVTLSLALVWLTSYPAASSAGVILQLKHDPGDESHFPWKWDFIKDHVGEIKAAGYTAILIPPHQRSCGYSIGYNPEDFTNFNSSHGSQQQLADLINAVHKAGLQIYADMVLNHMCTGHSFSYLHFDSSHFHHKGPITNYDDENQVEKGDFDGHEDLDQEKDHVRKELFDFLVKTNNMGFDGYRWDAARHVPRWYWKDHIVNNVNAWGKYNFGEVPRNNAGELQSYVDTGMAVTDEMLYTAMYDNFRFGGNMAALDGAGYAVINGAKALTYVENHDKSPPPNRMLAYAFLSAYPGYPSFFNVFLNDKVINNLVWIHEHLAHGPYINRYKDQNTLIFERAGHLLAAINQSDQWFKKWVQTSWKNTKLHDYSFKVDEKWTNDDGYVEVWVPPMSHVMLAPGN